MKFRKKIKNKFKYGFTLLEIMISIVILTIAVGIIYQSFGKAIYSWRNANNMIENNQHGHFIMNHLCRSLNSILYFNNSEKIYSFKHENINNDIPTDSISFVTTSSDFLSYNSLFQNMPCRIKLYFDFNNNGDLALFSIAMPIVDEDDYIKKYNPIPFQVSNALKGLDILFWDNNDEKWIEDWDKENSIPEKIKIIGYIKEDNNEESDISFLRILDIPASESLNNSLVSPTI